MNILKHRDSVKCDTWEQLRTIYQSALTSNIGTYRNLNGYNEDNWKSYLDEYSYVLFDRGELAGAIILKDDMNEKTLPIWIGFMEASSIAMELEKTPRLRPITHDLVKNLLEKLKYDVTKIEVTDLRDDTFYARIYLKRDDEEYTLDSRPSDAIAIALRTDSPIFVNEEVIEKSKKIEIDEDKEKLAELLDNISEGDFGKYKM